MAKKSKKKSTKKSTKKSPKKATLKKGTLKKVSTKIASARPHNAFMKPLLPSKQLAVIVGSAAIPRTEIMKKVWAYIKKNNLQDSKNRRAINADNNLKAIFGGKKQVTMFEMTKLVSNHLK